MRSVRALLNVLEHDAREETVAQKRRLALVESQIAAIRANKPAELEAAVEGIERELEAQGPRDLRRLQALVELSRHWSCDARALTLGSVAERAGDDGRKLGALRGELREAAAAVRPRIRTPEVSLSSRCTRRGRSSEPKRSASSMPSTWRVMPGPPCTGRPWGLSIAITEASR